MLDQAGATVRASVPVSIWPAGQSVSDRGEQYDYTAQVDVAASPELVGRANRSLSVSGVRYKVISAEEHRAIPHLALTLRRMGE